MSNIIESKIKAYGELVIKAKHFANELISHNLKEKNLNSESQILQEYIDTNKAVRNILLQRGVKPKAQKNNMKFRHFFLFLITAAVFAACSPKGPYALTNKVYHNHADSLSKTLLAEMPPALLDSTGKPIPGEWVGTVNFNLRKPNYVVIHYTAQDSVQQTLKTFTMVKPQTSAHYVIAKNGKVYHMLNDYMRSWHAGVGKWGNVTDMNSSSIGIELDNKGNEPFAPAQINSLLALLAQLKKTYNIPAANFIGHQDVAPPRKQDPGKFFPWMLLAQKGYGLWYDTMLVPAPEGFDTTAALRIIGYDTSNLNAAIIAFKNHFIQTDATPQLTPCDLDVLYNLYKKY